MTRRFDPRKMRAYDPVTRSYPPTKPSTPAQDAARARSWQIVRLRSLWFAMTIMGGWRMRSGQALVDDALKELGAEPQGVRHARELAELEARLRADQQMEAEEHD